MFYVGQKVVCVDDGDLGFRVMGFHPGSEIKVGDVYVVRDVGVTFDGRPGLKLQGKKLSGWNRLVGGRFDDFFYAAIRFRPVVSTSTDTGMAILREILDRETVKDPTKTREPVK